MGAGVLQGHAPESAAQASVVDISVYWPTGHHGWGSRPPFRSSLLTRVLSDSFASPDAMIVAIGLACFLTLGVSQVCEHCEPARCAAIAQGR